VLVVTCTTAGRTFWDTSRTALFRSVGGNDDKVPGTADEALGGDDATDRTAMCLN